MKTLVIACSLLSTLMGFSQTKQIAHKSHSGKQNDFVAANYSDNFGIVAPKIDTIKLLKNNCIVEIPQWGRHDTVCDHPYFTGEYTLDQIKTFYPSRVVFVGFEGKFFNDSMKKPIKENTPKKNSFNWMAILLFVGLGSLYILSPNYSLQKKRK